MNTRSTLLLLCCVIPATSLAQVRSSYLYNTNMPYGTLDIRTKISSTDYYYLQEGKTFSFRESSPGVKTNTFRNMTSWDSNPYGQGNLRRKKDTRDDFIMNYRLLLPLNYKSTYSPGYPMIVLMHGAVERGNCYYDQCYHSNWDYDPNVNSPRAPRTVDHKLLNNDHNLNIGGRQHLDARNLAEGRLPNDPTMPNRAFPGFVLIAQMFNEWEPLGVENLIRLVRLHCDKYKIDPDRIYIHGLSIGGYASYEAIKRAPWLFAAALPMSAVGEAADIFKNKLQSKVAHIPLWIFQGALDESPSPAFTQSIVDKFRSGGSIVRYRVYSSLGHNVWNKAYGESEFFSWMLSKSKSHIHARSGNTVIVKSKSIYPRLMLADGFRAYQWERNGVILSTATSSTFTATETGTYRARFSRVSSSPTSESQWNKWSPSVKITEGTAVSTAGQDEIEVIEHLSYDEDVTISVYPNPSRTENLYVQATGVAENEVHIRLLDITGRAVFEKTFQPQDLLTGQLLEFTHALQDGVYILLINDGKSINSERVIVTH